MEAVCQWLNKIVEKALTSKMRDMLIYTVRFGIIRKVGVQHLPDKKKLIGLEKAQSIIMRLLYFLIDANNQSLESDQFNVPRGPTCIVAIGGINEEG